MLSSALHICSIFVRLCNSYFLRYPLKLVDLILLPPPSSQGTLQCETNRQRCDYHLHLACAVALAGVILLRHSDQQTAAKIQLSLSLKKAERMCEYAYLFP